MNRELKAPVSKIDDVNVTWQSIVDESQDKLVGMCNIYCSIYLFLLLWWWPCFVCTVIDCHQEWCGPCEAIAPTLQRLFIDYDHSEDRLVLATVAYTSDLTASGGSPCGVTPLGEKVQAIIPPAAKVNLETQGCVPLFLCLRVCTFHLCVPTSTTVFNQSYFYFSSNSVLRILLELMRPH